jgi:hypothetical protein
VSATGEERIVLVIETQAQLDALKGTTDNLGELGDAARKANQELTAGSNQSGLAIQHVDGRVRTATNAMVHLADAAEQSQGSLGTMAIASGHLVSVMAELSGSARLVASASGIGALVTILATVLPMLTRGADEAEKLGDHTRDLGNLGADQLRIQEAAARAYFDAITQQYAASASLLGGESFSGMRAHLKDRQQEASAQLDAIVAARQEAERQARDQAHDDQVKDGQRAVQMEGDLTSELERGFLKRQTDLTGLELLGAADRERIIEAAAQAQERLANLAAEAEFTRRKEEIAKLKIDEDEKTKLLQDAYDIRMHAQADAAREAAREVEAAQNKQFNDDWARHEAAVKHVEQTAQAALHAALLGGESLRSAATKALLTPLMNKLEAKAIDEGVEALASLAFGDFRGAALHGATAAAAIAGAAKIAQIGGLGSGFGGSVAVAGGAGGGGFVPGDNHENAGDTTVVIQTVDPTSRSVVNEVGYQLQRGGVLKQPLTPSSSNTGYPAVATA